MPLIQWNESFSVNVPHFDLQHIKMIDMINSLHRSMKLGEYVDTLESTLRQLESYILDHFEEEEGFMESIGYPEVEKHRRRHNELIGSVEELRRRFEANEARVVLTLEVFAFLKEWLETHIRRDDGAYGIYLEKMRRTVHYFGAEL